MSCHKLSQLEIIQFPIERSNETLINPIKNWYNNSQTQNIVNLMNQNHRLHNWLQNGFTKHIITEYPFNTQFSFDFFFQSRILQQVNCYKFEN